MKTENSIQVETINYGLVTIKSVMFEGEFNNLYEGLELKSGFIDVIEIHQDYDMDYLKELTENELIELIENLIENT